MWKRNVTPVPKKIGQNKSTNFLIPVNKQDLDLRNRF